MRRPLPLLCIAAIVSCAPLRHREAPRDAPFLSSIITLDTIGGTVTLPIQRGRIRDELVWYIVTESSDRADARRRGVTWAPRLAQLAAAGATQYAQLTDDMLEYSAGVDFTPARDMRPARDSGFPPLEARAGSVGRRGYSPFVLLRNGTVINAPIIADESGALDRVLSLDVTRREVVLRMSRGYALDRHAWYISTEASDETVAAFERATYAPALERASTSGALSGLLAIVNGVTDRASADRQGLQSALLSDLSPLNVLQHAPDPTGESPVYSPLWDLHMARWTASAIASNQREKIFTFDDAAAVAKRRLLISARPGTANTALGGLQAAGIVINCPLLVTFDREPH